MIPAVWGKIAGVLIILMLLSFCAIWIWAWLSYQKTKFDFMASLPMNDEEQTK